MSSTVHDAHTAHHEGEGEHHYQPQVLTMPHAEVTQTVLRVASTMGRTYKLALALFGGLFIAGFIAFIVRAQDGFDTFTPWGYLMATFAFIFTTAMSAPIFSVTQRMVRSHWRRPMGRSAEIMSVAGIVGALMFIPLVLMLPNADDRKSIWFGFPGAPHVYQLAGLIGIALLGMAILYVSSLPDLAAIRDHGKGWRKSLATKLAPKFRGTPRQWKGVKAMLMVLGALYFLFLIGVHTMIASDFALSLVPGWKDAIFPAWHAISGLQSAVASTILVTFLLYKFGGYKDYISVDQFWGASKIMLALSLLWMYFWLSGFMIFWYGRQPVEQAIIKLFFAESYRFPWAMAVCLNFAVPFLLLIWNGARKSMIVPTIVACSILLGTFFDRIRIYVASFSVADVRADALHNIHVEPFLENPPPHLPGTADVFMILGGIGGAIFLIMLAMKFFPPISIWEVTEGMLYRKKKRFLKREIMVMGKPD